MFHLLPGEIVVEIISHACNTRPTISLAEPHDEQTQRSLATLCRVSKSFYAHAGRLLYGTVTIKDLNSSLIDSLTTIDASWVRSLIILDDRPRQILKHALPPYTPGELERWERLEDAVERMEGLESLVYEVDHLSPRLSAALSRLSVLRHLTAQNTVPFAPGPPPTQSLAVYWIPHQSLQLASLQSLIARSATILRKLHLSLHFVYEPEVPEALATMFAEQDKIPLLELVLDLPPITPDAVKILVDAIDMSSLVRLDLQESKNAACLMSALTGQVRKLRWLRVEGPVAPFIASFSGLEYLSWNHRLEEAIDVQVLTRHGASLKTLYLANKRVLTATDLQRLTAACQKLERLDIRVDFSEFGSVTASLATLRSLQELYIAPDLELDVFTLPDGPFHVRRVSFRDEEMANRGVSTYFPFLPYMVDGIDAALGLLLAGGVSCPDIGIGGIVPPYQGIFDHTLTWGRMVPRLKRWVKNGDPDDDEVMRMCCYRGGNIGDRYRCDGVEGEWVMFDPYEGFEGRKPVPLGKDRVPYCCTRKQKNCRPKQSA